MSEVEYIKSRLPKTELLAALAEEASELAQAALKLRRVLDGTSPTPVTEEQATANLLEEYGDVLNCVDVLITPTQNVQAVEMRSAKKGRWAERLKEAAQLPKEPECSKPEWISVKDKLPVAKGEYLVAYHPCGTSKRYWRGEM